MAMLKSVAERKICLARELKSELESRGYKANSDLTLIAPVGSTAIYNINLNIRNDGLLVIASWKASGSIHQIDDPDAENLATAIINTVTRPAQKAPSFARVPEGKSGVQSGARVANTVPITKEEYALFMALREKSKKGIWISKALYKDLQYGYIPPNKREELNKAFDMLNRRMSI